MYKHKPGTPQVANSIYNQLGDQWYNAYDNPVALLRAESRLKTPWIHHRIQKYFPDPNNCHILDLGCGAGFLSNSFALLGYSVKGIDLSEDSLSVARRHDPTGSVVYQKADAYNLPFRNSSFQVVTAMDFLEHVEKPDLVIQEAARVLEAGGLFFFHTFNRNWLSGLVVIKGVEWLIKNTPKHMHLLRLFITPPEMINFCQTHGLETLEITGLKPDLKLRHLLDIFKREVPKDFSFSLTPRLNISYLGFASHVL
ncbi:MAG: bifunctional 2-polyprenyl-6-hydroxyphenol methylase/3-demethylubiquinol 3-O-methyltransferase UbiG [Bdellovibrionia bacterium]